MEQSSTNNGISSLPVLSVGASNKPECIATCTLVHYKDFYFLINACHSIPNDNHSPLYTVAPNKNPIEIKMAWRFPDIDIAVTPVDNDLFDYLIELTPNNLEDTFSYEEFAKYAIRYEFLGFPVSRTKVTDTIYARDISYISTECSHEIYKKINCDIDSYILCDFNSKKVFYKKNPHMICTSPNLSGMSGGAIYRLFVDLGEKEDTHIISDFCGIAIENKKSLYVKGVRKDVILKKIMK